MEACPPKPAATLLAALRPASHWLGGLAISLALFYIVSLSRHTDPLPEKEETVIEAASIALPPPPPPAKPSASQERQTKPTTPKLRFVRERQARPIELLRAQVTPTNSSTLVDKVDLDFSQFKVSSDMLADSVIYEKREVDKWPKPTHQPFPKIKRRKKQKGGVNFLAMFSVTKEGSVSLVTILESTNPEANETVVKALEKWRFEPAERNGEAVNCWIRQRIEVSGRYKSPLSM